MRQRVITAIIALVVLLAVLFYVPPVATRVVFALVVLAGAWEWSAFLRSGGLAVRVLYVVLVGVCLVALTFMPGIDFQTVFAASMIGWLCALLWTFFFPTPIPAVLRWIGGIVVLVPLYAALATIYAAGPEVLLFALLIVWVADSGAFFAGKFLGKVKLAPEISPNKTWEGVVGGLAAVVLLTLLHGLWTETNLAVFVPFCLAVACISIVGDLTVSMFKRNAGVKDSGALFPGHGGVLDRIDSVASAAPLFALGLAWLGLGG
jgi:phosphatidate cytidylyltransferase